jgi:hypothetical protein
MMFDVGDFADGEVIKNGDLVALLHQDIGQVGANEASATGDENSHS